MKTSKFFSVALLATVLVVPVSGQAIGLGDLSGKKSSSGSSSSVDLSGAQTSLLKQYVAASQSVLNANELMASALGLEDEVAKLKEDKKGLNSGATKGALKDSDKASSASQKAIMAKLKENPELSAEAKVTFAKGIVSLVDGVKKYSAMKKSELEQAIKKHTKHESQKDLKKKQKEKTMYQKVKDFLVGPELSQQIEQEKENQNTKEFRKKVNKKVYNKVS